MAFIQINNVKIAGISACVPRTVVRNDDSTIQSDDYDAAAFVELTGVRERRIDDHNCTSDLCVPAAEKLISDLDWDKKEIDGVIFVSQTTDYYLPATACIIQERLGLNKECYASDIVLGCSGWVYGLSSAAAIIGQNGLKKVLLMAGDAKRHFPTYDPLFGFAGTVTALEFDKKAAPLDFHFGTDGSGYDAIFIPDGGSRNQITKESFNEETIDGKVYNRLQTRMKGMDVFAFGITTAPKSVKKLCEHIGCTPQDFDYYIFHQANLKMNAMIEKKLKLDHKKVPISMPTFGNTSSASIPLTIVTELKDKVVPGTRFLTCGFGVGLSWGTLAFTANNMIVSDLVEIN